MNKEPTEFQYFKAWLFFFVVATVCTWPITLVLGSFLAAFLQAGGASLAQASRLIQIVRILVAVPASYVTFRIVVGKYLMPKIIWGD
jgi:hypothetical protein